MAFEQWTIRLDPEDDKEVRNAADKLNVSLTAFVIKAAVDRDKKVNR
jgi:uncharacterized protein (DUF1778 family)